MSDPANLFSVVRSGLSAQMIRINAAASNLANAGSIAASKDAAYRPLRPVFAARLDAQNPVASVKVAAVVRENSAPIMRHDPDHPLADAQGNVWETNVDETAEMVEIMESARQYRNLVEALQTAKQLMLETMRSN